MQNSQGMPNTRIAEMHSIASFKALSAEMTRLRRSARLLGTAYQNTARTFAASSEAKRESGYGTFINTLKQMQGKVGGSQGKTIDKLFSDTINKIAAKGGKDIGGKELSAAVGELKRNLASLMPSLTGATQGLIARTVKGLGDVQSKVRGSGFKGIASGQKDITKAAFGLRQNVGVNEVIFGVVKSFKKLSENLGDSSLKASLDAIRQGMWIAAAAAKDTGSKMKALGEAQKKLKGLLGGASGGDKAAIAAILAEIKQQRGEYRKQKIFLQPIHRGMTVVSRWLQNTASGLGKTMSVMGAVKRTFDVTNGVFQSVNNRVNQFARMQMGITAERAGYGRQLRGSGIRVGEAMGALAAGRSAGMADSSVINKMIDLQTQMAQARWGEGGMIERAGRWGISSFNMDGSVRTQNEMMIQFSRKLKTLGSEMEKLQFITHMGFRPEEMEYVANYEKEAERAKRVKANPELATVFDRTSILDDTGRQAKIDRYTKLEQKRRQILNEDAIQQGMGPGLLRMLNPENWFFSDWTARQKGERRARSEAQEPEAQKLIDDTRKEMKKSGVSRAEAMARTMRGAGMDEKKLNELIDAMKVKADDYADPQMMRDFEAAFEKVTGKTLETKTSIENICDRLNETFASLLKWAEATVKKLSDWLSLGPKGKEEFKEAFWNANYKTLALGGAGLLTSAAARTGGTIMGKIGDSKINAGSLKAGGLWSAGGSILNKLGKIGQWVSVIGTGAGIVNNWSEAVEIGKMADEVERKNKEAKAKKNDGGQEPQKYAKGGKSAKRAIFGEAGPEYAIPVEHTKNTADLLNRAAKESGFGNPMIGEEGKLPQYAEGGRFPEKGAVKAISDEEYERRRAARRAKARALSGKAHLQPALTKEDRDSMSGDITMHGEDGWDTFKKGMKRQTNAWAKGLSLGFYDGPFKGDLSFDHDDWTTKLAAVSDAVTEFGGSLVTGGVIGKIGGVALRGTKATYGAVKNLLGGRRAASAATAGGRSWWNPFSWFGKSAKPPTALAKDAARIEADAAKVASGGTTSTPMVKSAEAAAKEASKNLSKGKLGLLATPYAVNVGHKVVGDYNKSEKERLQRALEEAERLKADAQASGNTKQSAPANPADKILDIVQKINKTYTSGGSQGASAATSAPSAPTPSASKPSASKPKKPWRRPRQNRGGWGNDLDRELTSADIEAQMHPENSWREKEMQLFARYKPNTTPSTWADDNGDSSAAHAQSFRSRRSGRRSSPSTGRRSGKLSLGGGSFGFGNRGGSWTISGRRKGEKMTLGDKPHKMSITGGEKMSITGGDGLSLDAYKPERSLVNTAPKVAAAENAAASGNTHRNSQGGGGGASSFGGGKGVSINQNINLNLTINGNADKDTVKAGVVEAGSTIAQNTVDAFTSRMTNTSGQ